MSLRGVRLRRTEHCRKEFRGILFGECSRKFFLLIGFEEQDRAELSGPWISKVVGLPEVRATYVALALPNSSPDIELIEYHHPASPVREQHLAPNEIGIRHIAFAVDDIAVEVNRLKKEGVKFLSDIQVFPASGKKLVYLHGPEQIVLELAEYPAN